MILVLGVFKIEVEPMLEEMEVLEKGRILKRYYQRGIVGRNEVVVSYGFIGKVEAALVTQAFLDKFSIDAVFLTGNAGGLEGTKVGDVVIGDAYVEYDFETALGDKGIEILGNEELEDKIIAYSNREIKTGLIASGDSFVTTDERAKEIMEKTGALCVDMDSAAVAKVCHENEKKFLAIKTIVDVCGKNTEEEFKKNYEKYGFLSNLLLLDVLKKCVF
ncbi:5'-methylthioadenosine/S-adenosylhomocysteine nucleosidase [Thermotoga sp. KOL6]|uniref:5'-methylthioadenosine/S-adenosylhomocysteine nucleosidase n=1 Tax=Thermotoga sp. KOL6 TaxID=126741 RepID=UPI000C762709|nr:5'-methylthioadenosine/S-adenosylhomocysteine nucleosidase [Thermotoga sp. KOL6]PLV59863.1 nucleosidase [Thermotoga sp. KOL6]